ncbi:putative TBC1 domain family member 2A [Apostichopus japonicus]|uniref:Putative TBC1 domain family member 2A n=1 Tax=Stichopus japonicus TaxID=307972 RepID=A0A2G8LHE0_STIJA|nr:putative TBC1 domain family member 2A [Apostichopus japonicus]
MGIYWRGQVGVGHSQTRVQNRILLQPTFRGRRKADTHTHGPRQTLSPRRGNSGPAGQAGNYKSSGRDGTTLPVLLFSDQKTGRHLASHSKPKTPEHKTHQTKTLPYGDLKLNITPTQKGHVGGDRRLTGRLPAHLDTQRTPTIPSVPVRRTRLPVPGAPIRPSHGSQNLHESRGSSSRLPQKKRGHPLRISRRLVGSREQSIGSNQQRPQNAPDPSRTGLDREPEEITAITLPDDPVPRGHTGLHHRGSPTLRRKSRGSQGDHTTDLGTPGSPTGTWLRALGLMASLVDIVRLCRLHMRPLQLHLLRSADPTDPDKTTLIYRSEEVTQHFRWWLDPNNWSSGVPFAIQLPMTSITTDASLSGWGAHWSNRTAWGTWSQTETSLHINILEMMAVKRALEAFNDHVQGTITTIFTDNTTVVAYINRQGGTRSERLCRLAWEVITAAEDSGTILRASHIAGKLNVMADAYPGGI